MLEKLFITMATIGNSRMVEKCLLQGVDVNVTNKSGDTALHKAAEAGHTRVADVLLNSGAYTHWFYALDQCPFQITICF